MDEKKHHMAHRRMVARRGILKNRGRNNNSPATAPNTQPQQRKIEDLGLYDFDMCYSLSRTGWSYADIGRRYQISETDVKTLVQGYVELRELFKAKLIVDSRDPRSGPELNEKKPRKRRSDAKYATAKDRQAAYRARLKDNRHADGQQPSRTDEPDTACQADEQLSVTVGPDSAIETSPESADPQHSTSYCPSQERSVTSENVTDPVTVEGSGRSEALWVLDQ